MFILSHDYFNVEFPFKTCYMIHGRINQFEILQNSAFTHWRQCVYVHVLSAICDHKQREGCGRWVVGYCC